MIYGGVEARGIAFEGVDRGAARCRIASCACSASRRPIERGAWAWRSRTGNDVEPARKRAKEWRRGVQPVSSAPDRLEGR
ncbi:MAG: hypothetical protein MZV65_52685 [Chromatiales bacterium]|nr:hypothetical protein [Chromatiales bacterium]